MRKWKHIIQAQGFTVYKGVYHSYMSVYHLYIRVCIIRIQKCVSFIYKGVYHTSNVQEFISVCCSANVLLYPNYSLWLPFPRSTWRVLMYNRAACI